MNRRDFVQSSIAVGAAHAVPGITQGAYAQPSALYEAFDHPSSDAELSVVYHWTDGLVTREGIKADLEGMVASGIRVVNWFYFDAKEDKDGVAAVMPKSTEWWQLVEFLIHEAKRLQLVLAPHICSSWRPAGSSEITPETSQQYLTWNEVTIRAGEKFDLRLPKPTLQDIGISSYKPHKPEWRGYHQDVAVLAFPILKAWEESSWTRGAKITTNLPVTDVNKLAQPTNQDVILITSDAGWIGFEFDQPFTLRNVVIEPGKNSTSNSYRIAHSLEVHSSTDGVTFHEIGACEPMYNSWQTEVSALSHTVTETTAKYFRVVYNPGPPLGYDEAMKKGSRPGGGDFAYVVEPLNLASVVLSAMPTVHHLQGKNASTWGRSRLITDQEVPRSSCIQRKDIVDLSSRLRADGSLSNWHPGDGDWRIVRFGCVSRFIPTGGGLECDKFSPDAARIVFDGWFKQIQNKFPSAPDVVKVLNIDSWETRSQNWSPVFREEFRKRRGYDILALLPAMAGYMVESATATEAFLLDVRRTISECIADNFFGTLRRLANEAGALLQAECIAPTMMGDGIEFYKNTDWVGGEFWVRTGQNWKPNDIADAVAGARLYGKKVIFAEAYTGGSWQDSPFDLKALGDHNFVQGVNRTMLHLWREQYYPHRNPGIPGAGTPFNSLNTWWKPAQPWRDYLKRVQALLQEGDVRADVLYFTGENIPCRALVAPELGFGFAIDPPLPAGYKHDTINRDALLRLAKVRNGKVCVGSTSYALLVLRPDEPFMSAAVAEKLRELVNDGASILGPRPLFSSSLERGEKESTTIRQIAGQLWGSIDGASNKQSAAINERVFTGLSVHECLRKLGVKPALSLTGLIDTRSNHRVEFTASAPRGTNPVLVGSARLGWGVEWLHRAGADFDMFFISNQEFFPVAFFADFLISGRAPQLFLPDTGIITDFPSWNDDGKRTTIALELAAAASLFVVFQRRRQVLDPVLQIMKSPGTNAKIQLEFDKQIISGWTTEKGSWTTVQKSGRKKIFQALDVPAIVNLDTAWDAYFPTSAGEKQVRLKPGSWTEEADEQIRNFSGTARYKTAFDYPSPINPIEMKVEVDLRDVRDIGRVLLNGEDVGTTWKAPYTLDITKAVRFGGNEIIVEVTNTWTNRLLADAKLPLRERSTFPTGAGFSGWPKAPLPAGLIGPVRIITWVRTEVRSA